MTRAELQLCKAIATREGYSTGTWARAAVLKRARELNGDSVEASEGAKAAAQYVCDACARRGFIGFPGGHRPGGCVALEEPNKTSGLPTVAHVDPGSTSKVRCDACPYEALSHCVLNCQWMKREYVVKQ